jgi:cell wall-associated NlpC family hydrolase
MMTRIQSVAAARSWLKTPYVLGARVKGSGVDCATILAEWLIEIGATTEAQLVEIGFYKQEGVGHMYSADWFCNTNSQAYLKGLMKFGKLVAETVCRPGLKALPGDLVLFRAARSRIYNHGAIVTEWPFGVHAAREGVREVDLTQNSITAYTPMEIFDPFL